MAKIFKHMGRQQETLAVVGLTLVVVLLYTFWGASVLHAQKQASAHSAPVVATAQQVDN